MNEEIKHVRTYEGDMVDAVKNKQASVLRIAVAEEEKIERLKLSREEAKKNIFLTVGAIVLVAGGISTALFSLFQKNTVEINIPKEILEKSSLVQAENIKRESLPNTSAAAIRELTANFFSTETVGINTVALLTPVKRQVSGTTTSDSLLPGEDFLRATVSGAPSLLLRSIEDNFAYGLYNLNQYTPFLVLKTKAFENVFSALLEAENRLPRDFEFLFGQTSALSVSGDFIFEDIAIRNIDFRVAKDKEGVIVFLYAFPDKETLVVTKNTETFFAIVDRLTRRNQAKEGVIQ